MTATIKKILIGASVAAGMSAIASAPAFATNLVRPSNIQFTTNGVANTTTTAPNLNTWTYTPGTPVYDSTGIGGVRRRVLNDFDNYGNMNKAAAALSDNDSTTNVELWTRNRSSTDRAIYDNVGFTANLGNKTIKVESVTKADWADGVLATAWLTGFRNAYSGLMQTIATTGGSNLLNDFNANFNTITSYLTTNGFTELGDANIGDITFNNQTNELKVDLVGHLDAAGRYVDTRRQIRQSGQMRNNTNFIESFSTVDGRYTGDPTRGQGLSPDFARNTTGMALLDQALIGISTKAYRSGQPLQISEVAKVTFDGKVDYAFAFAAIDSGAIAGDRSTLNDFTSHTGIYSWTKKYETKSVPEPSTLLGLIAVSGLIAANRKVLKKA